MDWRAIAAAALLLAPAVMLAEPEAASPDSEIRADDPYSGLISQVQERLSSLGFDAGPANGDFGTQTQAALAQFQLLHGVPVSGQLDAPTLEQLGVERDTVARTEAQ
jgi:peptidoglycan hydrolase-like protein with peptidoglycan-binding domain